MTDALAWSGTFHAIGARLLREYALQVGLDTAFTIHDREDSADLINLVRHDLGFSKMEKRFPMNRDVSCDLFAGGERGGAAGRGAWRVLPLVH
jgi:superfamily I DNA/RNA helicase